MPLTCFKNVDNISLNTTKLILSHTYQTLYTTLFSILFGLNLSLFGLLNLFNKSDLLFFDLKKMDKKFIDKFLYYDVYCYINIKDFLPK